MKVIIIVLNSYRMLKLNANLIEKLGKRKVQQLLYWATVRADNGYFDWFLKNWFANKFFDETFWRSDNRGSDTGPQSLHKYSR